MASADSLMTILDEGDDGINFRYELDLMTLLKTIYRELKQFLKLSGDVLIYWTLKLND